MLAPLPDPIPTSTGHPKRKQAYLDALELQRELRKAVLDPTSKASDKASCARAWEVLEERKRILRGKPLPGQLRPELAQLRKARRAGLLTVPLDEPAPGSK
jgi:hypothetical protein